MVSQAKSMSSQSEPMPAMLPQEKARPVLPPQLRPVTSVPRNQRLDAEGVSRFDEQYASQDHFTTPPLVSGAAGSSQTVPGQRNLIHFQNLSLAQPQPSHLPQTFKH